MTAGKLPLLISAKEFQHETRIDTEDTGAVQQYGRGGAEKQSTRIISGGEGTRGDIETM